MPNYRGLNIRPVSFGNVSSDALFGPLDQEIFDFYEKSKNRYSKALDIGANIGVHSILMAKQGWHVKAYEPDPWHFEELWSNAEAELRPLDLAVDCWQKAVSNRSGRATFVRVSNNSTGSHLEGLKASYGPVERFEVDLVDCRPLIAWADFAKVDCEGAEADILETVTNDRCEFMVEVSDLRNAERIFEHFISLGIGMWAQKSGWKEVKALGDMPCHHSQGMLFIGRTKIS
jgi:FkbM family methyltransferase